MSILLTLEREEEEKYLFVQFIKENTILLLTFNLVIFMSQKALKDDTDHSTMEPVTDLRGIRRESHIAGGGAECQQGIKKKYTRNQDSGRNTAPAGHCRGGQGPCAQVGILARSISSGRLLFVLSGLAWGFSKPNRR